MTAYRILRRADHQEMPWLNGGGSTLQVASSPEGAGLEDFDWRVSFARVERNGPFSTFPGTDRVITLVDGPGLRLTVSPEGTGEYAVTLGRHEPFAFAGDDVVSSEVSGPTVNLNLMTRRGRRVGQVRTVRLDQDGLVVRAGGQDEVLVAVLAGQVTAASAGSGSDHPDVPGDADVLGMLDVLVDIGADVRLTGEGTVALVTVRHR